MTISYLRINTDVEVEVHIDEMIDFLVNAGYSIFDQDGEPVDNSEERTEPAVVSRSVDQLLSLARATADPTARLHFIQAAQVVQEAAR